MPRLLRPFIVKNLGVYGIIRSAEVNDRLLPNEAITESINFHYDSKGASTVRPGLTSIQSTAISASYPCVGLYMFSFSSGSALLSTFSDGSNNDIYTLSNNYWIPSLEDDTKGLRTRFVTFADNVIRTNGTDTVKDWDGSGSWGSSGAPLNVDELNTLGKPKYLEISCGCPPAYL